MTVPFTFAAQTSAIPLSELDTNFATPITIGNTAAQLGNTVTTLNNMTLANVTITSGNISNVGNMGVGVVPTAWDTAGNTKVVQVSTKSSVFGADATGETITALSSNWYLDSTSSQKYIGTGNATQYIQSLGSHYFFSAGSGTANAAISFTQVLLLDPSGNMIAKVNAAAPTLTTNSTMTFELTSNTQLKVVVRGTDGTTRRATLTLA